MVWNTAHHSHYLLFTIYYLLFTKCVSLTTLYSVLLQAERCFAKLSFKNNIFSFVLSYNYQQWPTAIIHFSTMYKCGPLGMVSNVFVCVVLHYLTVVTHCFTTFAFKSPKAKRIFCGAGSSIDLVQETIATAPFPNNGMYAISIETSFCNFYKYKSMFNI